MSTDAGDTVVKELDDQDVEIVTSIDSSDTSMDSSSRTLDVIRNEGDCFLPQLPIKPCDGFEVGVADKCQEEIVSCVNLESADDNEGDSYFLSKTRTSDKDDSLLDLDMDNAPLDRNDSYVTHSNGTSFLYSSNSSKDDQRISPEIFYLANLSPTHVFGKDDITECSSQQKVVPGSRSRSQSNSTLNTPDPVYFEDTDPNGSSLSYSYSQFKPVVLDGKITLLDEETMQANGSKDKSGKRKRESEDFNSGIEHIYVPNKMNSRPGSLMDGSTWNAKNVCEGSEGYHHCQDKSSYVSTTVSPSLYVQSSVDTSSVSTAGINNKPMCTVTVPPYNRISQPANVSCSDENTSEQSSCHFDHNQGAGVHSAGFNYDIGQRIAGSSAAYRIDFSSPVPFADSIPMIVSQPSSYLPSEMTRPLAIPASPSWIGQSGSSYLNNYWTPSSAYSGSSVVARQSPYNMQGESCSRMIRNCPVGGQLQYCASEYSTLPSAQVSSRSLNNLNSHINFDLYESTWTHLSSNSQCQFNSSSSDHNNQIDDSVLANSIGIGCSTLSRDKDRVQDISLMEESQCYPAASWCTSVEGGTDLYCWETESENNEICSASQEALSNAGEGSKHCEAETKPDENNNGTNSCSLEYMNMPTNLLVTDSKNTSVHSIRSINEPSKRCTDFNANYLFSGEDNKRSDLKLDASNKQNDLLKTNVKTESIKTDTSNTLSVDGHVACTGLEKYNLRCSKFSSEIGNSNAPSLGPCLDSDVKIAPIGKQFANDSKSSSCGGDRSDSDNARSSQEIYPRVNESNFHNNFLKARRTQSPVSAFCAVLDLHSKKKKEKEKIGTEKGVRDILPRVATPSIPVQTFLNQSGPTLTYSTGNVLIPYMNSVYSSMVNDNYTNTSPAITATDNAMERPISDLVSTIRPLHPPHSSVPYSTSVSRSVPYSTSVSRSVSRSGSVLDMSRSWTVNAAVLMASPFVPPVRMDTAIPLYTVPVQVSGWPQSVGALIPPVATQGPYIDRSVTAGIESQTCTSTANKSFVPSECAINLSTRKRVKQDDCPSARRKLRTAERRRRMQAPRKIASANALAVKIQGDRVVDNTAESKSVMTFCPPPDPLKLRSGTITSGRKDLKARHYHFTRLQIGKFKFQAIRNGYEDIARVKFFFRRKKMMYEFQLATLDDEPVLSSGKHLVQIEVPFSSIVGLWLFKQDLRVEVNEVPEVYLGVWNQKSLGTHAAASYNRKHTVDITNGELAACPYHYIQFRSPVTWRITSDLLKFDIKFATLLRQPFIVDPKKVLQEPRTGSVQHYLLDPSIELPVEEQNIKDDKPVIRTNEYSTSPCVSCDCQSACENQKCSCCKQNVTCTEGACSCTTCRNPLNILHQMGLPQSVIKTDRCLMDNLYQVKHLDCYVKTQLMLECCRIPVLLLQCIPGQIICPNCRIKYKFSWCLARLCNERVAPRNHCSKCAQCSHHRNRHCERCNVCYFAGESGQFKCPICHNEVSHADEEESTDLSDV